MIVMAVDPGLRHSGVSIWDGGQLVLAALVSNPVDTSVRGPKAWLEMARAVEAQYPLGLDTLVVELQQMDSRASNVDDLFQCCGVVGALVGCYDTAAKNFVGYYPRQWSLVPKLIRHARLYEPGVLSAEEWLTAEPCSDKLLHNRDDAICLGLYHLRKTGERT